MTFSVLRPIARIAGTAAVAEPDVQVAVGTERDMAAVVIRVWLTDAQERPAASAIDSVGVRGRSRDTRARRCCR